VNLYLLKCDVYSVFVAGMNVG